MTKSKKLWETVYEDYDGIYMRRVSPRLYHFINHTDLEYNCRKDEFPTKYHAQLDEVDLDAIPRKTLDSAIDSCGYEYRDQQGMNEDAQAVACNGYGARALLWQEASNNLRNLVREAKRESRSLDDPRARDERLRRPVNAIGSSALELMQGDITSALTRGVQQGDDRVMLMAKMYGATEETLKSLQEAPRGSVPQASVNMRALDSDDPLAFTAGYMRALGGSVLEANREELASEYIRGYQVGVEVRLGETPVPAGVQHCA